MPLPDSAAAAPVYSKSSPSRGFCQSKSKTLGYLRSHDVIEQIRAPLMARIRHPNSIPNSPNDPNRQRERFPWLPCLFCQSFISTGAGFFFGATGAAVSSDGSLFGGTVAVVSSDGSWFDGTGAAIGFDNFVFGATGTDVRSVGRGRGNGVSDGAGNEPSRCRLVSVPVTRVNQVETSCAIADRGDRGSVRAGDGACAFTDAAPSVTRNREYVVAFRTRTCTVSVPSAPNKLPG
jgi:hypothetical protein